MTDTPRDHEDGAAADEAVAPDTEDVATAMDGDGPATAGQVEDAEPGDDVGSSLTLQEVAAQRDTYLDHLRRERAEFENFRRRSQRERMEALDRGAEGLVRQLLDVLDNFGYVLEAAKDSDDAVAKGVRMVHDELRGILERAGLEDVPGVDAPFDPTWHDAVMQVEGEATDDEPVVAQVLRNGYRFKGRVLRPASVAVTQ